VADRLEVPLTLSRSRLRDEAWELDSAAWHVERMCAQLGLEDLRNTAVLDMGCGVKLSKLFVSNAAPVERYVGLDVHRELIQFLQEHVTDPRFEYHHLDVRNDLYNPGGVPLEAGLQLPLDPGTTFDLICLFSVFTHLPPDDYHAMLKVLRRYVRPDGRLFFTLYVNELTPDGHGLIDGWVQNLGPPDAVRTVVAERLAAGLPAAQPFVDLNPARPLEWAVYSREYAYELIEGTGWRVLGLFDPDAYMQHHFLCAPA
jgi:SAM-dependent methyltransferase